ncbi:hypothetical protein [Stenotrophomonas pigmentata]|uniref:hypothetical protein n=1 Tax=Stenotrophomonas pigmentata TaxID=3055080 RepID=UPI0026EDE8CB|nr:hypothetical protein [Stenotrophomonas sp. 610A2]
MATLASVATATGPGAAYVRSIAARYEESVHLRYLLRMAFLPPATHRDIIGQLYVKFLEIVRAGFLRQLHECSSTPLPEEHAAATASPTLASSRCLYVELVYEGPEPMKAWRDTMWQGLMDSL